MRKDKGLNGDLDRLPMLAWIMFLKFLDDMERVEEERTALAGKELPADRRPALPLARLGSQRRMASPGRTSWPFSPPRMSNLRMEPAVRGCSHTFARFRATTESANGAT